MFPFVINNLWVKYKDASKVGSSEEASRPVVELSPCSNGLLAGKYRLLYLYLGMFEASDGQLILSNFYCLDMHKMAAGKALVGMDPKTQEWLETDSKDDIEGIEGRDEDEEDEDTEKESWEEDAEVQPSPIEPDEELIDFLIQMKQHWVEFSWVNAGPGAKEKKVLKAAHAMTRTFF